MNDQTRALLIQAHRNGGVDERQRWSRYRAWYNGEFYSDADTAILNRVATPDGVSVSPILPDDGRTDADLTQESNYPFAFLDTMASNVCPSAHPEVTVNARDLSMKAGAEARQMVINDTFRSGDFRGVLRDVAIKTGLCGRGFIKAVWDPVKSRVDLLDIDPAFLWFDMGARTWDRIRYLIEIVPLTRDEFNERVQSGQYDSSVAATASFGQFPAWFEDLRNSDANLAAAAYRTLEWVIVYEFHDFSGEGTMAHYLENAQTPLFSGPLPYTWLRNPYFLNVFNKNLRNLGGLSDIKLIAKLLERLNELDTLELRHVHRSIPSTIIDKSKFVDPEASITALSNGGEVGALIDVGLKDNAPIRDAIMASPTVQLPQDFERKREQIVGLIEFILGIPQYARGRVGVADVATEIALADTSTRTRNGVRQQKVYGAVEWAARAVMALYRQFLGEDEVQWIDQEAGSIPIYREDLRFPEESRPDLPFKYDVIPMAAIENSRPMKQKNLMQSLQPILLGIQAKVYDATAFFRLFAEVFDMKEIVNEGEEAQMPLPPEEGGAPGSEGASPPAIGGETPAADRLATGQLAADMEEPAIPAAVLPGAPGTTGMGG